MEKKPGIIEVLFVAFYVLSLIIGFMMAIWGESFHITQWLLSGSVYPFLVVLYHAIIIAGCVFLLLKRSALKTRRILLIMSMLLIFSRMAQFASNLVNIINVYGLNDAVIGRLLTESLVKPGGIVSEVLSVFIVIMLYSQNNSDEKGPCQ